MTTIGIRLLTCDKDMGEGLRRVERGVPRISFRLACQAFQTGLSVGADPGA